VIEPLDPQEKSCLGQEVTESSHLSALPCPHRKKELSHNCKSPKAKDPDREESFVELSTPPFSLLVLLNETLCYFTMSLLILFRIFPPSPPGCHSVCVFSGPLATTLFFRDN